jgi:hypothetical protein
MMKETDPSVFAVMVATSWLSMPSRTECRDR